MREADGFRGRPESRPTVPRPHAGRSFNLRKNAQIRNRRARAHAGKITGLKFETTNTARPNAQKGLSGFRPTSRPHAGLHIFVQLAQSRPSACARNSATSGRSSSAA
jgi:hypothetical protein